MVEFLVIVVVLAVLIAAFLPAFIKPRVRSSKLNYTNHLKQVGLAFRMWGLDNEDNYPMQVSLTNGGTMELIQSGRVYPHSLVMSNELNTPKMLLCPEDKTRHPALSFTTNFSDANISYFIGLDASGLTQQSFLAGDDNLLVSGKRPEPGLLLLKTNSPVAWARDRHKFGGNVGLADGSVLSFTSLNLAAGLIRTGMATNRLAMP